jgi:WD40 repeat protein
MRLLGELPRHRHMVSGFAFTPDGQYVVIVSPDTTAIIAQLNPLAPDGVAIMRQGRGGMLRYSITSVTLDPQRMVLVTVGGWRSAVLWDISDPLRPERLGDLTGIPSVTWGYGSALAPDGSILAIGGAANVIGLIDIGDPRAPRVIRTARVDAARRRRASARVDAVAFHPSGACFATGTSYGAVSLWDATDPRSPREAAVLPAHNAISSLAYAPDGSVLATSGADATSIIWDTTDLAAPRAITTIRDHGTIGGRGDDRVCLVFSPTDPILISVDVTGKISAWDMATPSSPALVETATGRPGATALAYSPDGHALAIGNVKGEAELWHI